MRLSLILALLTMAAGDEKIIGGRYAEKNKYPFAVAMVGDFGAFCGGTLVALNKVITAGHCVAVESWLFGLTTQNIYVVLAGSVKKDISTKAEGMQSRHILSIQLHPEYKTKKGGGSYHDIAACILLKPFDLSPTLSPMKWIAKDKDGFKNAWYKHLKSGDHCVGIGWGYTKKEGKKFSTLSPDLKAIILKPETDGYCSQYGRSLGDQDMTKKGEVCLSSLSDGEGVCSGDSGSPLICGGYVFGLLSVVFTECGKVRWPAKYLLFWPYMDIYNLGAESSALSNNLDQKYFILFVYTSIKFSS